MSYVWFTIRWNHLLAMAFFVGSQMLLAAVVVPVERRAPIASGCEPSRDALARARRPPSPC
jgi:hypothetical protein